MSANFLGGSAFAMANQICEGYILLSKNTLKGFGPGDLNNLTAEIEKLQREVRAEVPPQDDAQLNQNRNRRIGRLTAALTVINHQLTAKR